MFQFAKFEKSKERRLPTELGYGFPIGDPWITDGISPWPFASESVIPSQCPGIHPMHSFRSSTLCREGALFLVPVVWSHNPVSESHSRWEAEKDFFSVDIRARSRVLSSRSWSTSQSSQAGKSKSTAR
ncbi:hypothetical protein AgCh_038717 [Apium graveolens]